MMENRNNIEEQINQFDRFIVDERSVRVSSPEDMICAACIHRSGDVSECRKYLRKPHSVLSGGKSCKHFKREE